ncbi:MAG: sigma 54-interacting transcriptional regulator [Polyangiaceae bacterium]|nr:sigma 54-interacting transcriptional regulator [Polyangiaceae bacterium]
MLVQLRKSPPEITPELQALLDGVTEPAILLDLDHRILAANSVYRARYGDVGTRCYAATRELESPCDANGDPCPLRASMESGRRQRVFHIQHGATGPRHVDVEVEPVLGADGRIQCFLERVHEISEARGRQKGELVGRAPVFLRALGLLQRAAPSEVPVLLLGESGTGKELAARAIHQLSGRRERTFMPVECSGLPETLFESELFGYEAGAFTGAARGKRGLVDATGGGTLFLDEIGDVPLSAQVKLLRLLESGTFRKVGGTEPHRADFRLVCATHRDLASMVREGTFRRDLYYRINAFPVVLPPLRERRGDVALLARELLSIRYPNKRFTPSALARLEAHDWPGNVRELRNVVERVALLADGDALGAELLADFSGGAPDVVPHDAPAAEGFQITTLLPLEEVERAYLSWAAARRSDRRELAVALGLSERTLYRKLADARRHA